MALGKFGRIGLVLMMVCALVSPLAFADEAAPRVDLNTATLTQLDELPGIGPALAARIVAYRDENGPFQSVEELMNVRGVAEKSFSKLEAMVTVSAPGDESGE